MSGQARRARSPSLARKQNGGRRLDKTQAAFSSPPSSLIEEELEGVTDLVEHNAAAAIVGG